MDAFPHFHRHLPADVAIAAGLALLSALAFAVAIVAQQRAAARVSDEAARSSDFARHLLRDPRWVAGIAGNAVGFTLQALALHYGSLLVVQPLLVASFLFALPLSARLSHARLPRSVWLWEIVLAVSLTVFVIIGDANHGADHATRGRWLAASVVMGPLLVACLLLGRRAQGAARSSSLAIGVGLLGGVLAVLTKTVVAELSHSLVAAVSSWPLYALIVVGLSGTYLQQLSFQAGDLHTSLPIITVLEPIVAAIMGLTMFHERLRVAGVRTVLLAAAVVIMVIATVAVARSEASYQEGPTDDASG
ncbi:MAG TPA: DMT family transporter [Jatrophihabitans sp.]|jgi:drug/metabolite transporter (DMT)-like permease|uniref:DMT family transporter n=1 Tax=Jatrophihabitans sp. TaxID=1932789 RepID=UPI002E01104A|nr:DMT family transporter [Jatrophihabitans sp.]